MASISSNRASIISDTFNSTAHNKHRRLNSYLSAKLFTAALLLSPAISSAVTVWATDPLGGANNDSRIITFDSENPFLVTEIGDTGIEDLRFRGLEFDRNGVLYAYGNEAAITSDKTGLYRINQQTGAATPIALEDRSLFSVNHALSYDPDSDSLFGLSEFILPFAPERISRFNLNTGLRTPVGGVETNATMPGFGLSRGLAIDASGNKFVPTTGVNQLYRLADDLLTTAVALPESMGTNLSSFSQGMAIDWSRDSTWLHAANQTGTAFKLELMEVSPLGSETSLGAIGQQFPNIPCLGSSNRVELCSISSSGKKIRFVHNNRYGVADIAIAPQQREEVPLVTNDIVLVSVASSGKKGIHPGLIAPVHKITITNNSPVMPGPLPPMKEDVCITLRDIKITGPSETQFQVRDFLPGQELCENESVTLTVDFFNDPALNLVGLHAAVLGIMTDQGGTFGTVGAPGETLSFQLIAEAVPLPQTLLLMTMALLLLHRANKQRGA